MRDLCALIERQKGPFVNSSTSSLQDVHIAILAGGSGTRLWPRSRRDQPKQFLNLVGARSMLQQTVDRVLPLVPIERIYVLTGPDHATLVAEQLPDLPPENLLIEPSPKGTAPCLGLAAIKLHQRYDGQAVMVSLHADHAIAQEDRFRSALLVAVEAARQGHISTIGIVPTQPETGFGYIERAEALFGIEEMPVYRVARFTEKPPLDQAREFVASGRFFWNAGYFAWTLERILGEFQRSLPAVYSQLTKMISAPDSQRDQVWNEITPVTIDVGIMEHAERVAVIPCDMGWNDIGSWAALSEILACDEQRNVILGQGQHIGLGTSNSLIYSDGRLIATIGLENLIVVDTGDAVLVLPRDRAQEVSALVKMLQMRGLNHYL